MQGLSDENILLDIPSFTSEAAHHEALDRSGEDTLTGRHRLSAQVEV